MGIDNLISEIDAEIARLEHAHTLLSGVASPAARKRVQDGTESPCFSIANVASVTQYRSGAV